MTFVFSKSRNRAAGRSKPQQNVSADMSDIKGVQRSGFRQPCNRNTPGGEQLPQASCEHKSNSSGIKHAIRWSPFNLSSPGVPITSHLILSNAEKDQGSI